MRSKILIALLFISSIPSWGQDTVKVIYFDSPEPSAEPEESIPQPEQYYFSGKKEIGLDVTGLLAQLTPFNTVKAPINLVGFKFKKYARRYAFRMSFGFDIDENEDNGLSFFYFSAGYERRRILGKKFAYNSGWEALLGVQDDNDGPFVGFANFHGLDYNINQMVFLGIETQLRLTVNDFAPNIKLIPPTAVYLNVRF